MADLDTHHMRGKWEHLERKWQHWIRSEWDKMVMMGEQTNQTHMHTRFPKRWTGDSPGALLSPPGWALSRIMSGQESKPVFYHLVVFIVSFSLTTSQAMGREIPPASICLLLQLHETMQAWYEYENFSDGACMWDSARKGLLTKSENAGGPPACHRRKGAFRL